MADPNKTESATPKKRREARDRGEVARSHELSSSLNMIAGLAALGMAGTFFGAQFKLLIIKAFHQFAVIGGEAGEIDALLIQTGITTIGLMLPVLAAVFLVSLAANYLQVGFYISTSALTPKLDRVNPLNGFKRIFSTQGWVELLKASFKIIFTSLIVVAIFYKRLPELIQMTNAPLLASLNLAGDILLEILWKVGLFFLLLGLADWVYQKYQFEQNLKMTKQEVRDEYRQTEGDPQVKVKRRAKHRKLSQTRMAAEVARADVVTTNPTHYAVALRYDANRMRAPRLVAKGQNFWAKRIVAIARKHAVPVIENKPLTRAMYKTVEIGQEVPPTLYRAVAEILALIYKMRARRRQ